MPAASRSATSSRIARAIWAQVSERGWSSRTKDQLRMVTGPVSIPLTGRAERLWAKVAQRTVIGAVLATSPTMIGGRT
jgi:hypothetical protein